MNAEKTQVELNTSRLGPCAPFEDTYSAIKIDNDTKIHTVQELSESSISDYHFCKPSFTLMCTNAQGDKIFSQIIGQSTCDTIYSALFK